WFRKTEQKKIGSAIVVHFLKDFWGIAFLSLPEMKKINQFLEGDNNGLQLIHSLQKKITTAIEQMEQATGVNRIQLLLDSLHLMSQSKQYKIITKDFDNNPNLKVNSAIDKIFTFSFNHFLE